MLCSVLCILVMCILVMWTICGSSATRVICINCLSNVFYWL